MKIGFDAKRLYNNFTGLGNYSRFIVGALSTFYPENEYFLFTPKLKSNPDTQFFLKSKNLQTILPSGWISKLKLGSLWRSFMISGTASAKGIAVYHGLSHELPAALSSKIKKVVTVHDLIFLRYPEFYKRIDVSIYKAKMNHACNSADCIVAISEQTKQDIIEFLKIDPEKIKVIYQGCHANFMRVPDHLELARIKLKYALPADFILNVGTIESRKNALHVVKALKTLKDKIDISLVIIGRATNYVAEIKEYSKKHGLEKQVLFIHETDFVDLPAIYRLSRVFVYPSLFEGFGIPLVEAIACEVPVITSTGSCFTEAAGPDAIYVDPFNVDELANQLHLVLTNEALRLRMIASSTAYIKKFNPEIISAQLIHLYSSLVKKLA